MNAAAQLAKSIQSVNKVKPLVKSSLPRRRNKRISLLGYSNESSSSSRCFSTFDSIGNINQRRKPKSVVSRQIAQIKICSHSHSPGLSFASSSKRLEVTEEKSDNVSMSKYIVGHDEKNNYFYIKLQADASEPSHLAHLAKLEYVYIRPGVVDLWHTEVPPEFQGHGIAKYLAKAAFDYFCEKEIRTRPTCTYLQKYLKDFPTVRYLDNIDKTPS